MAPGQPDTGPGPAAAESQEEKEANLEERKSNKVNARRHVNI